MPRHWIEHLQNESTARGDFDDYLSEERAKAVAWLIRDRSLPENDKARARIEVLDNLRSEFERETNEETSLAEYRRASNGG